MLDAVKQSVRSECNRLGFALRNFLSWQRGGKLESPEPKDKLFLDSPELKRREALLRERYDLSSIYSQASRLRYRETLAYLEWLDVMRQTEPEWFQAVSMRQPNPVQVFSWLDVGAKNWSYVEALRVFIESQPLRDGGQYQLDGVEIDPNRRYTNFRTRQEHARSLIQGIPQARYHTGDILRWQQPASVISHFLPFVYPEPHLAWGLPLDYFKPQAILNHLLRLLEPNGLILIVNQGEWETQAQENLLKEAQKTHTLEFHALGVLPTGFLQYKYPRYGWLIRKQAHQFG